MYKKILVPLDGSQLAEAALPHASQLACDFGSGVVLLTVSPPIRRVLSVENREGIDRPSLYWLPNWSPGSAIPLPSRDVVQRDDDTTSYVDQQEDRIRADMSSYLRHAGESLTNCGAKIIPEVVFDDSAADAIIDYAIANGVDLIVMSTHGRGGVGRWVLGSVAEKVLRGANVPVLLIRCVGCSDNPLPTSV